MSNNQRRDRLMRTMNLRRPARRLFSLLSLTLLTLSLVQRPALAEAETVGDWLMRMNDAATAVSYRGVFVLRHKDQMEAMRIVHDANPAGVRERLFSLNGEPREIIRNQQDVWCYLPSQGKGVHQQSTTDAERRFPGLLPTKISKLEKNYRLLVGAEDRIADRIVRLINVIPNDEFRYGRLLWIDTESGLILKADTVANDGSTLEQYQFVEIEYLQTVSDQDMSPHTPRQDLEWHSAPTSGGLRTVAAEKHKWTAQELPSGFAEIAYSRERSENNSDFVHHAVYSDGLASVSIFIQPVVDEEKLEGPNSMGAMSAFGVVDENNQITAMGEVPMETLRLLATSTVKQSVK